MKYFYKIKLVLIGILIILLLLTFATKEKILKVSENKHLSAMKTTQITEDFDYFNEDFWQWNTRTTTDDIAYNGKHIQLINTNEKRAIDFFGYGVVSYKDYIYKEYENFGEKIFKFKIEEVITDYHTLDGVGFIFNSKKEDGKITGNVFILDQNKMTVYRLEDVNDIEFQNTPNKVLADYVSKTLAQVDRPNTSVHNMEVRTSPTNLTVIDNNEELLNIDLDYTTNAGNNFGVMVSYKQHSCSSLSQIELSEFSLEVRDYKLPAIVQNDIDMKIEGAQFDLLDKDGNVISKNITSNEQGKIDITGIQIGEYILRQKTTIDGHKINDKDYIFIITGDGKAHEKLTNEEIEEIIIINERIVEENSSSQEENSNQEGSNSNKEENINKQKDNTISKGELPQTGENIVFFAVLLLLLISITYYLIKIRKISYYK